MIILFGPAGDEVISFLVLRLKALGEPFALIDPHQIDAGQVDLTWDPADRERSRIRHGSRAIELESVQSVYLRELSVRDAARPEMSSALFALTEDTDALVLNRSTGSATNGSKPYQARRIEAHGFRSPPGLITTDPEAARAFYEEHHGRIIHKSISQMRSIVVETSAADLERLPLVRNAPTQFQALVAGTDVRVHVVGERVFATEIRTSPIDYRYAAVQGAERRMRDTELPAESRSGAWRLSRALDMGVSGIDLRRGLRRYLLVL